MKVIHIFHALKFSGAEIMYVAAAPLFQQKECKLWTVATTPELGEYAPFFERAGYTVLHKPYLSRKQFLKRLQYHWQFSRLLKRAKIDVVHIHAHGCMLGFSFATWLAGKRSVYTFHSVFPSRKITWFYHYMRRWSAKHLFGCHFQTISDSVYENELNYFHNPTTKIYNWYASDRFFPAATGEKQKLRKELGIADRTLVVVSVGRCDANKRHTEILKALPAVLAKKSDVLYLHLGEGVSLEEEQQLAHALAVSDHVRFVGNQTDVRKYLIVSDIYLMTSRFEGISLTTIEAMGCTVPAILYDVPGLRDFNKTGDNSILIPEDHKILAEKILSFRGNETSFTQMADRAKAFVDANFDMATNVEKIYELYR